MEGIWTFSFSRGEENLLLVDENNLLLSLNEVLYFKPTREINSIFEWIEFYNPFLLLESWKFPLLAFVMALTCEYKKKYVLNFQAPSVGLDWRTNYYSYISSLPLMLEFSKMLLFFRFSVLAAIFCLVSLRSHLWACI